MNVERLALGVIRNSWMLSDLLVFSLLKEMNLVMNCVVNGVDVFMDNFDETLQHLDRV